MTDPSALPAAVREIAATGRTPIVLVDGVGSMGGLIDVASMLAILQPFGGHLYVDDAHGVSIDGSLGAGYAFEALGGTLPRNVVLAGSLSKAFGGAGGFAVVPSDEDMWVLRSSPTPWCSGTRSCFPCWRPTSPPPGCTSTAKWPNCNGGSGATPPSSTG